MKTENPSKKDYVFVGIQLLLFVSYVFPIKIRVVNLVGWLRYSGLVIAILGLILGGIALFQINTKISPFPTPIASSKLHTDGAFALARHPIYTSILAITLGYALYDVKSIYEEQLLLEKFPEYSIYKLKNRRFI
ncbi:methyltransferase family protein [Winogradskyella sp.]|uniref:methyltransferase family protein n=1 Tax=Winogradskyella sp. TaxID=1883156 RepID=UPI003AB5A547